MAPRNHVASGNRDPLADPSSSENTGFSFNLPPASFSDADAGEYLILSASLAGGNPPAGWLVFP